MADQSLADVGAAKRKRSLAAVKDWVNLPSDPHEMAAIRTLQSVGQRKEGKVTQALSSIGDAIYNAAAGPSRLVNAHMGEYQPGMSVANMPQTMAQLPEVAMNVVGGPGVTGGASTGAGGMALGVVPVDVARRLKSGPLPQSELLERAVQNTPGASIDDGLLKMRVTRNQHPDQEMSESVRGGVFYLPEGSASQKYYTGKGHNFSYGGSQPISGETAVSNPLFVKGATGGKAPQTAYDQLNGKGAYEAMRSEALRSTGSYNLGVPHDLKVEATQKFLEKYAPEMAPLAEYILQNSTKGNQMAYALQEAAVASAARKAGHDAVIGYSTSRKTKEPFISEVFDVRENRYPGADGDYSIWPELQRKAGGR